MVPPRVRTDGFVDPCIPSRAPKPPSGPDWVHEIKHDGYRLIVRSQGETVRLFTRRGYDWTDRYPAIARAAAKLRAKSFTIDGEAAVCVPDGIAIFDALHRRGTVTEAMLYAFDLLELDGVALAQLSQLGEKSKRYQHRHSESLHYTALAERRAVFSSAVIRGGGCGGRSSLRWRARSFWSAVSSV